MTYFFLADTADTVSHPVRHSLPQELENLYGSDINGRCTSVSGANSDICSGTSVLNDGVIPALSGVGDSTSQWAAQLFTMRRSGTNSIVVSFDVQPATYDCVELAVFNCPERGIYAPSVIVYVDTGSFLPERSSDNLGFQNTIKNLSGTSCDYLLKFNLYRLHWISQCTLLQFWVPLPKPLINNIIILCIPRCSNLNVITEE